MLSSFSVHLKPSQHCELAIPQYKIKNSKENKIKESKKICWLYKAFGLKKEIVIKTIF